MTKQHVENLAGLDVRPLPWNPPGLPTGAQLRMLAKDPANGGFTGLVDLPAGYRSDSGVSCNGETRLFVIDGSLQGDVRIGEVGDGEGYTMVTGSFLRRPPHIIHGPLVSKNGNVNLCYTHARLGIDYHHNPRAMDIIFKHLKDHPWT